MTADSALMLILGIFSQEMRDKPQRHVLRLFSLFILEGFFFFLVVRTGLT